MRKERQDAILALYMSLFVETQTRKLFGLGLHILGKTKLIRKGTAIW